MKYDFEATFPQPQFVALHGAGRSSVFEGMEGDELALAVRDCITETALSMQSDLGDAAALVGALHRGVYAETGLPIRKREHWLQMIVEAEHIEHLLKAQLADFESEFGMQAAEDFAAHYLPELATLAEKIAGAPREPGAGPLFD